LQKGEKIVDLGSGAGIDVFMSANKVGRSGRVIGIDMTEEMLERARRNAKKGGYANVEFRKGDIEKRIPVDSGSTDAVISNCVINLTTDKVKAFKEIHRILKDGGRMVISDLVADRKGDSIDPEMWSSCIDGAIAKSDYLASIRKAGFKEASVLEERQYMDGESIGGRKITSIVVVAVNHEAGKDHTFCLCGKRRKEPDGRGIFQQAHAAWLPRSKRRDKACWADKPACGAGDEGGRH
jgi:SAM-dependent methyltransferase